MFYRGKLESDLSELVGAISGVEGVLAAILFGSRAKGEADEYSDYDVLVIFESDEARRKNWDELYERVSRTGLFTQVLARSLKEVRERTEPTFLREILEHGRVVFSRYPIEMPAAAGLTPARIVTYDLMNLSRDEKQRFCSACSESEPGGTRTKGSSRNTAEAGSGMAASWCPRENTEKSKKSSPNSVSSIERYPHTSQRESCQKR